MDSIIPHDENQIESRAIGKRVHAEIYGVRASDSPISIQLQKLDKYIQERQGKISKPDTFDQFEYGFYA